MTAAIATSTVLETAHAIEQQADMPKRFTAALITNLQADTSPSNIQRQLLGLLQCASPYYVGPELEDFLAKKQHPMTIAGASQAIKQDSGMTKPDFEAMIASLQRDCTLANIQCQLTELLEEAYAYYYEDDLWS